METGQQQTPRKQDATRTRGSFKNNTKTSASIANNDSNACHNKHSHPRRTSTHHPKHQNHTNQVQKNHINIRSTWQFKAQPAQPQNYVTGIPRTNPQCANSFMTQPAESSQTLPQTRGEPRSPVRLWEQQTYTNILEPAQPQSTRTICDLKHPNITTIHNIQKSWQFVPWPTFFGPGLIRATQSNTTGHINAHLLFCFTVLGAGFGIPQEILTFLWMASMALARKCQHFGECHRWHSPTVSRFLRKYRHFCSTRFGHTEQVPQFQWKCFDQHFVVDLSCMRLSWMDCQQMILRVLDHVQSTPTETARVSHAGLHGHCRKLQPLNAFELARACILNHDSSLLNFH